MSGVQTTLALQDRLTGPLMKMIKAMDNTIKVMEKMDKSANNLDIKGLAKARKSLQSASADMERLKSSASGTENGFRKLKPPVDNASQSVRNFFAGFAGAASAYLSIQGLTNGFKNFVKASDTFVSTNARLALINDQTQTQLELQEKVYQAAQRSRSGYNDLAGSVAKLNLLAEDAFSGNDEAIRFSELMGKAFTISGASTQERQAGMYQLTQAMAAGRLQGDEFRSIMENAPLLAQAIADSLGKSKGELKEMSAEGTITADIIKNALFGAATDIEEKFSSLPLTFAQAWQVFSNWATRAFEPLFIRFNQFVNSDAFGVLAGLAMWFINVFIAGMTFVFDSLENFYNMIAVISQFVADNISWLGPIFTVLGVILGSILSILIVKYAVLGAIRLATLAWAAAQWVVNAAYLSNPIALVLIAIVAVIALIIYALINWQSQTAATIGFITGLFFALGVAIYNIIAMIWNYIATFAEFLINIFIDPTYAVQKLFYDMVKAGVDLMGSLAGSFDSAANTLGQAFVSGANLAISAINWIVDALNMIPGIELGKVGLVSAGAGVSLSNSLKSVAANLKAPTSSKSVYSAPRMTLGNIPAAFAKGNTAGQNLSNNMSDKVTGIWDKATGMLKGITNPKGATENPFNSDLIPLDLGKGLGGGTIPSALKDPKAGKGSNPTGGKLDSIGKIDDEINIAEEDLKLLRELAEIRSIQNFVTLQPTTTLTGNNIFREEADVDKLVDKINERMVTTMKESAEGVYG